MYSEFTVSNGDVRLYCRRFGEGVPILLIHGACVDCDFWRETAEYLSKRFMVITYDRRGYSRSTVPSDNDFSIRTQADDAARIIQHISQPACVIAHSGGATIALELISEHPELVKQCILYEAPVCDCLPEDSELLGVLHAISKMISEGNYTRALNQFWRLMGCQDDRARLSLPEEIENLMQNSRIFIQHEFDSTFYYHPKYDLLRTAKIFIAKGDLSDRDHTNAIASVFSAKISGEVVYYPGMHNCAFDLPASFAYMSAGVLLLNASEDSSKTSQV